MSGSNGALLADGGARAAETPGWPGDDVYPPQPMVSQTRAVVDDYAANGGTYREEVIPDGRPTPHVEKPEPFRRHLDFLDGHSEEGRLP